MLLALLGVALAVRVSLLFTAGYVHDQRWFRRWAVAAATHGLAQVYVRSDMDYPPLYAYMLAPLGHAYLALVPEAQERRRGGDLALWTRLAKIPPLVFDLATAALLFHLGRGKGDSDGYSGLALAAAYLLNPAVVFDTGHWGQPDSIHSFLVLLAFVSLHWGRGWPALPWLCLACLMKPLAAPYLPLAALLCFLRGGLRALALGALAALAVGLVVFAPFLATGQAAFVTGRVVGDLDRMPYTSVNAHNVWWLVGAWRPANEPLLGPLTATQVGLVFFGIAYAALIARALQLHRSSPQGLGRPTSLALAAGVGFTFFMFATHMHENHLFTVVPLLAALLPGGRRFVWSYVAVSAGLLLNLALHDLWLPETLSLGGETQVFRPSHGRPFFALELFAVYAAALFNLACLGVLLRGLLGRDARSWLAAPEPSAASGDRSRA